MLARASTISSVLEPLTGWTQEGTQSQEVYTVSTVFRTCCRRQPALRFYRLRRFLPAFPLHPPVDEFGPGRALPISQARFCCWGCTSKNCFFDPARGLTCVVPQNWGRGAAFGPFRRLRRCLDLALVVVFVFVFVAFFVVVVVVVAFAFFVFGRAPSFAFCTDRLEKGLDNVISDRYIPAV